MGIILWLDPVCPYSATAFLWAQRLTVPTTIEVTSLALLNENNESAPMEYRYPHAESIKICRILAFLYPHHSEVMEKFMYLWHEEKVRPMDAAIEQLEISTAAKNARFLENKDDFLRQQVRSSQEGIDGAGGSPITEINGRNFFGPVFSDIPDDPVGVYEALSILSREAAFSGLSRGKK